MYPVLTAACIAVTLTVLYVVGIGRITKRRQDGAAKRLGCKPPPLCAAKLPLGFDHLQESLKADKEKAYPDYLIERKDKMGVDTFHVRILGSEILFTSEPKNIQALLATQFSDFSVGEIRRHNFFPLLGNGIFTQDGPAWEHSRAMMRPQFARDQVSDLDLEERHVQNMMKALRVDPQSGWTTQLDLQVLFFRLTLDSATEFLFGESADSQLAELPENKARFGTDKATARDEIMFATAFDTSQQILATRLRFADKYWLYNTAAFRSANKTCHDFIDHYVGIALKGRSGILREKSTDKSDGKEKYVFLEALATQTQDPTELRSQLLNILLAGRDTTASLLGWLFYLLARHPQVWAKLRSIVVSEFGTYTNPTDISFAKMKNCEYLRHCMNETLRLYPVVPMNIRYAVKDTTLPLGGGPDGTYPVFVKKGAQIDYSVHVMQRRKDLWGPDADEFKPERWLARRPGWEYLPFNGGPRICIGQQFALTEASYVTIRLLQRFDRMENLDTEMTPRHNFTLTSCSGTGVEVRLHEATA